jgi:hypothetical protein
MHWYGKGNVFLNLGAHEEAMATFNHAYKLRVKKSSPDIKLVPTPNK